MKNKIIDNAQNFITNTYTRYPVVFQTGSGVNLFGTPWNCKDNIKTG